MNYKNILFLSMTLISLINANAEQKTMELILVKQELHRTEMIPFSVDFFNEIRRLFNVDIFVETGTYLGDTTALAATVFKQVHTIELSKELFTRACSRFANTPNIFLYEGDSGAELNNVLPKLAMGPRVAILLDGHWNGGITGNSGDVPVARELDAIGRSGIKNSIIIVDDIRDFQYTSGNQSTYQYPDLSLVIEHIKKISTDYSCVVYGDILIAYTDPAIVVPEIVRAMTTSRLGKENNEALFNAETIIASASDKDFNHLSCLARSLKDRFTDFWYALALHKRDNKTAAQKHMREAARQGLVRAQYYLSMWQ